MREMEGGGAVGHLGYDRRGVAIHKSEGVEGRSHREPFTDDFINYYYMGA